MTFDELLPLSDHIAGLETEMLDMSDMLDRDDVDALDRQWDRISERFHRVDLELRKIRGALYREEKLRKENETLRRLYEEYKLVYNLIGSEHNK